MSLQASLIFPLAGLTYLDIVQVACEPEITSGRLAAKRLGMSERQFYMVIKQRGMGHWFPTSKPRKGKLTKRKVVRLAREGYTRRDAAYLAGCSYEHLKKRVKKWGLGEMFPTSGKSSWITRRGYAGND